MDRKIFEEITKINDYKIIKILGQGAFGIVFLVKKNKKQYALKLTWEGKETIDKEYDILSYKNNCKSVIPCVYDKGSFYFNNEIQYYLVMEYISGYTIDEFIKIYKKKNIKINEKCIIKLIYHTIKGINYLHSNNIVHSDLHSGNIIFNKSKLILIDLGAGCILKKHINSDVSCLRYLKFYEKQKKTITIKELFQIEIKEDILRIGNFIAEFYNYEYDDDGNASYPLENINEFIKSIISDCVQNNYKKRPTTKQLLKKFKTEFPYL